MNAISRMQEALAEVAEELAHADRLIEEQAQRIEELQAEVGLLRVAVSAAAA